MTLLIPEIFPLWLISLVAGHFPECDEDGLRRCGDVWADTAQEFLVLAARYGTVAGLADATVDGRTRGAMADYDAQVDRCMRDSASYSDTLARQCHESATAMEFNKLLVIGTGVTLLAQLALDALLFAAGAVKAAMDRAAAQAAWRTGSGQLISRLEATGAAQVATRTFLSPTVKALAIGGGVGAWLGGGVNLWAQDKQVQAGHRDEIDRMLVLESTVSGLVGGLAGVRAALTVAPAVSGVVVRASRHLGSYGAHVAGVMMLGLIGGVAGGVGGVLASLPFRGFQLSWEEFKTAVITGAGGGFLGAAATGMRAAHAATSDLPAIPRDHPVNTDPAPPPPPPSDKPDSVASAPTFESMTHLQHRDNLLIAHIDRRVAVTEPTLRGLEEHLRRTGVDRMVAPGDGELLAHLDYDWDPTMVLETQHGVTGRISVLHASATPADRQVLNDLGDQFRGPSHSWPRPSDLLALSGNDIALGRDILQNSDWYAMKPLTDNGIPSLPEYADYDGAGNDATPAHQYHHDYRTPGDVAVDQVLALPENPRHSDPDVVLDFTPGSDGTFLGYGGDRIDPSDVHLVADAVAQMLHDRGWRDPTQIQAAAELVRLAGTQAMQHSQRLDGLVHVTLRMTTHADHRSLDVSVENAHDRPERIPNQDAAWSDPIYSARDIGPDIRETLTPATRSGVEQWGEVWARFDEPPGDPHPDAAASAAPHTDLDAKAHLVRNLYDDHHIRMTGWRDAAITADALNPMVDRLRTRMAEFGNPSGLRALNIGDTRNPDRPQHDTNPGPFGVTVTRGTRPDDGPNHHTTLTLSPDLFNPETVRQRLATDGDTLFALTDEDFALQVLDHEFLHFLDDTTGNALSRQIPDKLQSAFDGFQASGDLPPDLTIDQWLDQLPDYCRRYTPGENTFHNLNRHETLAEGGRAGANPTLPATHPARVVRQIIDAEGHLRSKG